MQATGPLGAFAFAGSRLNGGRLSQETHRIAERRDVAVQAEIKQPAHQGAVHVDVQDLLANLDLGDARRFLENGLVEARPASGQESGLIPLIFRPTSLPPWLRDLVPVDW